MTYTGITFGALHATAAPPTRPGSLWGAVAVLNRPGIPVFASLHCPRNSIFLVNLPPETLALLSARSAPR